MHIIIASNVFEHLSNPEEVLKECFRILRPGGQLIATVPFLLGIHQAPYDFFRFTQFILKKMLEDCGFQERWVETIGSPKQVYLQMQKHYYQRLFKEQPNRLHPSALFLKFHWFAQGCINRYLPTIHQSEEPEPMPLGYGFVGTK